MSRVKIDWRSCSKENYKDYCAKHSNTKLTFDEWKDIIYKFNEGFRNYLLETGKKERLPHGFGDFAINKKKRKKIVTYEGKDYINLPVDWPKTREKGKIIYNFNHHTEGYFFGWIWFRRTSRIKDAEFWFFKPTRVTSRMLAHYLKTNDKYQHLYQSWIV
jgi:hypothetical protein